MCENADVLLPARAEVRRPSLLLAAVSVLHPAERLGMCFRRNLKHERLARERALLLRSVY